MTEKQEFDLLMKKLGSYTWKKDPNLSLSYLSSISPYRFRLQRIVAKVGHKDIYVLEVYEGQELIRKYEHHENYEEGQRLQRLCMEIQREHDQARQEKYVEKERKWVSFLGAK